MHITGSKCNSGCRCGWEATTSSGWNHLAKKKYNRAERLANKSLAIAQINQSSYQLCHSYLLLASLMTMTNQDTRAESAYRKCLEFSRDIQVEEESMYMLMVADFAFFLYTRKRFEEAGGLFKIATEIALRTGEISQVVLAGMVALVMCHLCAAQTDLARQVCRRALREHVQYYGAGHERTREVKVLKHQIEVLVETGTDIQNEMLAMISKEPSSCTSCCLHGTESQLFSQPPPSLLV